MPLASSQTEHIPHGCHTTLATTTASNDKDMNNREEITTRRLKLRRPRSDDARDIFERYASNPIVTKYLARPTHASIEDSRRFIETSDKYWNEYKVGPYLIFSKETEALLGTIVFGFLNGKDDGCAGTGYILAQDSWGMGYATEVLEAIIALARRLEVKQLVAESHADHVASIHILDKCGFEQVDEDTERAVVFPNIGSDKPQPVMRFVHRLKPSDV